MRNRNHIPLVRYLHGIHNLIFRQWRFTRYLWIIAGLLFIAVYIVGDYGLVQIYFKIREVHRLNEEIVQLEEEHTSLTRQKSLLEAGDQEYIEKIAREKFKMVKKDEVLYQVIKEKERKESLQKINSQLNSYDQKNP